MTRRASPAVVGAFVIVGLILVVTAIAVFGSGRFFRERYEFVCFFQGELNGLKVGAAVKFRGVPIGAVTKIRLALQPSEGTLRAGVTGLVYLPVIFELDKTQLVSKGITGGMLRPGSLDRLIKNGLRAQLKVESVLTGLLYIDLDLHPGTPVNLLLQPGTSPYREIPTVPTTIEQLQQIAMEMVHKFEQIDFAGLLRALTDASNSLKDFARSKPLKEAIGSLAVTQASLIKAAVAIRDAANNVDTKIDPLVASLKKTSDDADAALRDIQRDVHSTLEPQSPIGYQLGATLKDISDASKAVRDLADYLQRNPSALVRGKYVSENRR